MTNPERVDRAEIRRHLALITAPSQVIEVRAVGATSGGDCRQRHIIAGYFDDPDKLTTGVANYITRAEGIYVTLNEVNPALLARAYNRLVDRLKPTTGDADVLRRRIFYVDVDPVRPAQISATEAEHTLALARTRQISAYLQELGAPAPLLADSGNGGHALWRIDLPADDGGLVQDALRALARRFSDALAKVDETVGNPARIGKLYGTWARKGDSMADRPHRMARILETTERLTEMPVAILHQLKGALPAAKPIRRHAGTGQTPAGRSFDLKAWVERYLPEAGEPSDWQTYTGKGRKWAIVCPWNPEHTGCCAWVGELGNGAITAGCQHESCGGKGWPELRALLEGAHPCRRAHDAEHAVAPAPKLPQPAEATLGAECRDPDERRPDRPEPVPAASPGGAMGAGGGEPLGPERLPDEPPPWLGADGADSGTPPPPAKAVPRKTSRKRITSSYLINYLAGLGYSFRLNLCDDSVEVGGERISDVSRAQMRCQLRDAGLGKYLAAADDAVIASAASQPYHPVLDYFKSLTWDQQPHISQLAAHFSDTNGVIGLYLRKWVIGAVARAYTGVQNAVLVLDGAQGLGKSQFVRWLCPLPKLFVDANINPDDKDSALLAVRSWIWEVSELGATTRRADVEALKGFLSREVFTVRAPYGRFEIVKPGLTSFIGTVNNAFGVFSDSTGSRRYWATTLTAIDWAYARVIDINQVWAEAHAAYLSGESWKLATDEAQQARTINEDFAVPDPVEDLLRKYYRLDPAREDKWLSSADILTTLQNGGLGMNARANAMHLSATLKRLGHRKKLGGDKGKINGYVGIW